MNTEPDRIRAIIDRAVRALDPIDRAQRVAYCQAHNEHGVRAHMSDQDDLIELWWGGRLLAMVSIEALFGDGPVEETFVSLGVPDTVPDDF